MPTRSTETVKVESNSAGQIWRPMSGHKHKNEQERTHRSNTCVRHAHTCAHVCVCIYVCLSMRTHAFSFSLICRWRRQRGYTVACESRIAWEPAGTGTRTRTLIRTCMHTYTSIHSIAGALRCVRPAICSKLFGFALHQSTNKPLVQLSLAPSLPSLSHSFSPFSVGDATLFPLQSRDWLVWIFCVRVRACTGGELPFVSWTRILASQPHIAHAQTYTHAHTHTHILFQLLPRLRACVQTKVSGLAKPATCFLPLIWECSRQRFIQTDWVIPTTRAPTADSLRQPTPTRPVGITLTTDFAVDNQRFHLLKRAFYLHGKTPTSAWLVSLIVLFPSFVFIRSYI